MIIKIKTTIRVLFVSFLGDLSEQTAPFILKCRHFSDFKSLYECQRLSTDFSFWQLVGYNGLFFDFILNSR